MVAQWEVAVVQEVVEVLVVVIMAVAAVEAVEVVVEVGLYSVMTIDLINSFYSGGGGGKTIPAAINTRHTVETYPAKSTTTGGEPPTVDINSGALPLTLRFNSQSSQINAVQRHMGGKGRTQKSSTVDEPDMLIQVTLQNR